MDYLNSTEDVPTGAVVVGVDGSDQSLLAVDWAAGHADLENRPLVLVHATSLPSPHWMGRWGIEAREFELAVREDAQATIAEAEATAARVSDDLTVHGLVLVEDPRSALLRLSDEAASVVIGSRGRGPVRSLVLGSVGMALVRHTRCPVVVLRPVRQKPDLGVVVGIDARPATSAALKFAFDQAAARQLSVTVLHVAPDSHVSLPAAYVPISPSPEELEAHRRMTAEMTSGLREQYPDVPMHTEVVHGDPDDFLREMGERSALLVLGAHERGRGALALTSLVERVHCPVAVVPAGADAS